MMFSFFLALLFLASTKAYSIGDVNPRILQGIWRLTSLDTDGLPFEKDSITSSGPVQGSHEPMKEFTTYPTKTVLPSRKKQTELFIKLKDDMTFEQCSSLLYDDGIEKTLEEMLQDDIARRQRESFAMKGTWDYVDGKLILASDRREKKPFVEFEEEDADTILVGKVSITSEKSSTAFPIVENMHDTTTFQHRNSVDVHLSVPKGKIKTGKFMYPKHHPSFFEQPIFNPQSMGNFELQQVDGDHSIEEDDLVELFRKDDLSGKRFYLSTFPLPERKRTDWRGRVIEDNNDENKLCNIQVMALELFANNTFSTFRGLGSSEVRRGKWSIIGEKRDQVWIQVYRFGFGRSVSYGTFSEGMSLTQDDERTYWGKITEVNRSNDKDNNHVKNECKKVEIDGAIMLGTGLEPCSIGRFRMTEMEENIGSKYIDFEDNESFQMTLDDLNKNAKRFDSLFYITETNERSNPFDFPEGSFE